MQPRGATSHPDMSMFTNSYLQTGEHFSFLWVPGRIFAQIANMGAVYTTNRTAVEDHVTTNLITDDGAKVCNVARTLTMFDN